MGHEELVWCIGEIEAGESSLLIQKIAPGSDNCEIRAHAQMGIREKNPISVRIIEDGEKSLQLQDMISMDVVEQIFREKDRIYRVVMQSGKQYRMRIQQQS